MQNIPSPSRLHPIHPIPFPPYTSHPSFIRHRKKLLHINWHNGIHSILLKHIDVFEKTRFVVSISGREIDVLHAEFYVVAWWLGGGGNKSVVEEDGDGGRCGRGRVDGMVGWGRGEDNGEYEKRQGGRVSRPSPLLPSSKIPAKMKKKKTHHYSTPNYP